MPVQVLVASCFFLTENFLLTYFLRVEPVITGEESVNKIKAQNKTFEII